MCGACEGSTSGHVEGRPCVGAKTFSEDMTIINRAAGSRPVDINTEVRCIRRSRRRGSSFYGTSSDGPRKHPHAVHDPAPRGAHTPGGMTLAGRDVGSAGPDEHCGPPSGDGRQPPACSERDHQDGKTSGQEASPVVRATASEGTARGRHLGVDGDSGPSRSPFRLWCVKGSSSRHSTD